MSHFLRFVPLYCTIYLYNPHYTLYNQLRVKGVKGDRPRGGGEGVILNCGNPHVFSLIIHRLVNSKFQMIQEWRFDTTPAALKVLKGQYIFLNHRLPKYFSCIPADPINYSTSLFYTFLYGLSKNLIGYTVYVRLMSYEKVTIYYRWLCSSWFMVDLCRKL